VSCATVAALAPQPTLERLPDLADEVRAAGLDVTLFVDGDRGSVPAGVDLAGYRIVQEALTNVRRHAPGAAVTARVAYTPRRIDIEVRNSRTGAATPDPDGRGLVGMRERAHLYGGTFHIDTDDDAFTVRATLSREPT
jgi:signal transduction histidine kinase